MPIQRNCFLSYDLFMPCSTVATLKIDMMGIRHMIKLKKNSLKIFITMALFFSLKENSKSMFVPMCRGQKTTSSQERCPSSMRQ